MNKRDIKGFESPAEKFKGTIKKVVKAATAVALTAGLSITAVQAIEMFNKWHNDRMDQKRLENLGDIVEQIENEEINDYSTINNVNFEELEGIIKEYEQALENKDDSKKNELDKEVIEKGYFDAVEQEIKDTIITMLGCDPEKVEITYDGIVHVANKEQPVFTVDGPVATDKDGNPVALSYDQQMLIKDIIKNYAIGENGVYNTAEIYTKLLEVQKELYSMNEKEDNVINNEEKDIDER